MSKKIEKVASKRDKWTSKSRRNWGLKMEDFISNRNWSAGQNLYSEEFIAMLIDYDKIVKTLKEDEAVVYHLKDNFGFIKNKNY